MERSFHSELDNLAGRLSGRGPDRTTLRLLRAIIQELEAAGHVSEAEIDAMFARVESRLAGNVRLTAMHQETRRFVFSARSQRRRMRTRG